MNWNPPLLQPGASGQGFVDKDSGAVYLSTARVFDAGGYTLLHADPNGSVADAIYVPAKSPCGLAQVRQSLAATGWSFEVYDPSKFRSTGILAGTGLAMISTLRVPLDGGQHEISSGGAGVLDMDPTGNLWLYDPAAPSMSPKLISSPSAGQGLEVVPNFFEDALTWVAEGAVSMKIRLYHAGKTVNFIDYSGIDPQHGAGCLGGDGKDMVWVEGFGLENGARYKQAAYYTSPYTTDPSKLQPRRLRSDSYRILDTVSTTVGCGYAARFESRSVRIIRLSDGVSWTLPPTELDASFADAVNWVTPFAITCSEVWVMTERLPVRIDIASLGPGDPPD